MSEASDNDYSQHPDLPVLTRPSVVAQTLDVATVDETTGTWTALTEAYLNAAVDSANTRRAYAYHLKRAGEILGHPPVSQLTGPDLAAYRSVIVGSQLASSSKAQALSAMRSFLSWVGELGGDAPTAGVIKKALRGPRVSVASRYNVVTDSEAARILDFGRSARDRAVAAVLLGSGLRVSEVASLQLSDLVEDMEGNMTLVVRQGKGSKDRVVPVLEDVVSYIRAYLTETRRFQTGSGPLFLAHDRGAASRRAGLTSRSISETIRGMALAAGISTKKVSPHALRHTYAMRCIRAGVSVVALAKLMGHSNIATTQRYVDHLAMDDLRKGIPPLPASPRTDSGTASREFPVLPS